MGITAESVTIELLGKTDQFSSKMSSARQQFVSDTKAMESAAASGSDAIARSHGQVASSAGGASAASLILQSSIRRTSDQFAAGAPLATIFAEHVSGLAEAATLAGGSMGKFGEILAGPWGLALQAGVALLSIFISKEFDAASASGEHAKATKDLSDAIDELNKLTGAANLTDQQRVGVQIAAARGEYAHALSVRETTKALLEQAIATEKANSTSIGGLGGGSGGANLATVNSQNRVQELTAALAKAGEEADNTGKRLDQAFKGAVGQSIQNSVEAENDKAAAANKRYEDSVTKARQANLAGALSDRDLAQAIREADKERDAAVEAANRHTSATHGESEAQREAAKAAREAAAAQRELLSFYDQLRAKLDPLSDAYAKYKEQLAEIAKLQALPVSNPAHIDAATAAQYQRTAANQLFADNARINAQQDKTDHDAVFGTNDGSFGSDKFNTKGLQKSIDSAISIGKIPGSGQLTDAQQQQVQSLAQYFEDAFSGKTKDIWASFREQGEKEIAFLLARLVILQITQGGSILGNLKTAAGSIGSSGGIGSLLSLFGGKASGGYVAPGSIHRVNESGGGVELLKMGPQGGTVIPLGQTRAASGGMMLQQTIHVDARGAVMNKEFASQILSQAANHAEAVGQISYSRAVQDAGSQAPGVVRRTQMMKG